MRILLVCILSGLAFGQSSTKITPDCDIQFTFKASGNSSVSGCAQNLQGVRFWAMTYQSSGFSGVSLTVQSAPDSAGSPGSWSTFTAVSGTNPATSTTGVGADTTYSGYVPWIRVNASLTGSGSITGHLYGCKVPGCGSASAGGGGGGISGCGSQAATDVAVWSSMSAICGFSDFGWNEVATGTGMTGLQIGAAEPDLSCCDGPGNAYSVAKNVDIQVNYISAASSGNTLFSFYASDGTVASPTNLPTGFVSLFDEDIFGFFAGAYTFLGDVGIAVNSSLDTNGSLEYRWDVGSETGAPLASFKMHRDLNPEFMILDEVTSRTGGLAVPADAVVEVNNGTPVAAGGSLAQLNTGILNMASIKQGGSAVGSANAAVCWKTTTTLSFCTSVVGVGGTCTCM